MLQIILKKLREEHGLSQAELARRIGVGQSTVGMWENGKNKPEFSNLEKLSEIFGVPTDYLIGKNDFWGSTPESTGGVWIPVLGRVAAGVPIQAIEEIEDYEEITKEMARKGEYFALRVKGDSMEPRITDGDVVIVRQQDDCDTGDTAIVIVNGEEATVKRIKKSPEGLMLIPTNPAYEPLFFSNKEIEQLPVRVVAKVVELRAKF